MSNLHKQHITATRAVARQKFLPMQLLSEKILSFLFIIFLMNSLWQDPEINNFKIFTEAAASVHLLIATALLMTSCTREETLYFLADE